MPPLSPKSLSPTFQRASFVRLDSNTPSSDSGVTDTHGRTATEHLTYYSTNINAIWLSFVELKKHLLQLYVIFCFKYDCFLIGYLVDTFLECV